MGDVIFQKLVAGMLLFALFSTSAIAEYSDNNRILFINSYHAGYEWSDGIEKGLETGLQGKKVELEKFYMDSKRKREPEAIKTAAEMARQKIEAFKPDIVITADDNAAKHVIAPHYKDSAIPFVFTGVNWDASVYGFPFANVTGMEEVSLIRSLMDNLSKYAKGNRKGLISIDAISGQRNVDNFEKELGYSFDKVYYVKSFDEWKQRFLDLQSEVDLLILENPKGITGWDNQSGKEFIEANTRIPTGTTHIWLAPYAVLTIAKIPEEQGAWAAETALAILGGKPPREIPVVKNKQGKLYLNLKLATPIDIVFDYSMIKNAEIIK